MSGHPETVDARQLLELANRTITRHKDYFPAMKVTGVRQQGELLIFSGPWFTDESGLPGAQSTIVFNVFKFLTQELSPLYCLE